MAAIMEGTRFDYYNALEQKAYPVMRIFKMANRPSTIFIKLNGANPGWKVGQLISFKNAQTAFSGKIWYIHKGSTYYNLYVKHPNPGSVMAMPGGQIIAGSFPATTYVTGQGFDPVQPPVTDPYGILIGPSDPTPTFEDEPSRGPQASMLPSFMNQRNLMIAGIALAVVIVIRNI